MSYTLICTNTLIIILTLTYHTIPIPAPPPLSHSIPVMLLCHLYVKHKTIIGNIVYIYIQFVILVIVITFFCLTTIV